MELGTQQGNIAPMFRLPTTGGHHIARSDYRGKHHLVLVFLPDAHDDVTQAYLRSLSTAYNTLRSNSADVLAIAHDTPAAVQAMQQLVPVPFPVLIDQEGTVSRRFVSAPNHVGLFVLDRYGEIYYAIDTPSNAMLPSLHQIMAWIQAIDRQCSL